MFSNSSYMLCPTQSSRFNHFDYREVLKSPSSVRDYLCYRPLRPNRFLQTLLGRPLLISLLDCNLMLPFSICFLPLIPSVPSIKTNTKYGLFNGLITENKLLLSHLSAFMILFIIHSISQSFIMSSIPIFKDTKL
jgi:hypothetical protein